MYTKAMFQTNMESQGAILAACAKYVDEGLLNTTATDRMDFTLANLRLAQDKIKGMGGELECVGLDLEQVGN